MIASVVVVPETVEEEIQTPSGTGAVKRRQSSLSQNETDSKRPRLSTEVSADAEPRQPDGGVEQQSPVGEQASRNGPPRRSISGPGNKDEERKRGKRLFGSILGTLSQGSSSTTQRRRADIEKKQQAKLKLQDEELDEQKKKRRDDLTAARKIEQKDFDEQTVGVEAFLRVFRPKTDEYQMRIRHSNMLAMSNFLKTEAEPKIVSSSFVKRAMKDVLTVSQYYRPFTLRPEEEEGIGKNRKEAKSQIDAELEDFERQRPDENHPGDAEGTNGETNSSRLDASEKDVSAPKPADDVPDPETTSTTELPPEPSDVPQQAEVGALEDDGDAENGHENGDEHEELVVAGEDAVIY